MSFYRTGGVLAAAVCALGVAALTTTASATTAHVRPAVGPGPSGPRVTLIKTSQKVRFGPDMYGATADAAGNTYIGWIADATPSSDKRVIDLCTFKLQQSACSGGVQHVNPKDPSFSTSLQMLPGSQNVTMVWADYPAGATKIYKAVSQGGGKLSGPALIATVGANETLYDAATGPSGHIWTVTGDDLATQLAINTNGGGSVPSIKTPWQVGFAQIAFSGSTAVLAIQEAGSISVPVDYAYLSNGKWSAFKPLASTWSVGYAPGLTKTSSGLRIVTGVGNAAYHPVVASWQGTAFGPAKGIGDSSNCSPDSAETSTDASGRLADITNECGKITVDNLANTTSAAIVRFTANSDPSTTVTEIPQLATLPSGRAWAVYSFQTNASVYEQLVAMPLLLPALHKKVTGQGSNASGSVSVSGPVSCMPVDDTPVSVTAAPASGWHTTGTTLTLDGKTQGGTLAGASLTPGQTYTLAGTATFADGSKTGSATANLTFKACPKP